MKSKIYVHKIVLDQELNFHKDPCKDVRILGIDAHTPIGKRPIYCHTRLHLGYSAKLRI